MKREKLASECILCLVKKHVSLENENVKNKAQATLDLLKIVACATLDKGAPEILDEITAYKEQKLGLFEDFSKEKQQFNALMLACEEKLKKQIFSSADQVQAAVKLCLAANYIDFGSLDSVCDDEVLSKLDSALDFNIDLCELTNLKNDILSAKNIVYLLDNCGEIVLDKLFIELILSLNPSARVTAVVRGGNVLNDCTTDDAKQVNLDALVPVLQNGSRIAGTCLNKVNVQTLDAINSADVIISKGQGNFETMRGERKNTYFLFLCKCALFAREFSVPLFTPMLLNDLRIK